MPRDSAVLQSLIEKLQTTEQAARRPESQIMPTGWTGVDETLGGLARGVVHEWFSGGPGPWIPPIGLLLHLARRSLEAAVSHDSQGRIAVWIGHRCWPCLADAPQMARQTLLLDIQDLDQRVWAMELALRSPGVMCAVLDGEGLSMPFTRRLQIAAGAGHALALVVRPTKDLDQLSAASTRWQATPAPGHLPRWTLDLLRRKGVRPASTGDQTRWIVEPAPWP